MDDNVRHPKKQLEAKESLNILIETILTTKEKYKAKEIVKTLMGQKNALLQSHKTEILNVFGKGKDKTASYWMALIRQSLVAGYILKEIETYGLIRVTLRGKDFLKNGDSFMMTEDHQYDLNNEGAIETISAQNRYDKKLMQQLIHLRKITAKKFNVPTYAVFQEYSLEDMCLKYPITLLELFNINGVGEGKAKKYGEPFVKLIDEYVKENEIIRVEDLIVKSTGIKSALKLYLIQSIDRKLPFDDIASSKGMKMDELLHEMETIVFAGTRLNINYWIEEIFDDDQLEELNDYFMEATRDDIKEAFDAFEGDFEEEDIRLYLLKFIREI